MVLQLGFNFRTPLNRWRNSDPRIRFTIVLYLDLLRMKSRLEDYKRGNRDIFTRTNRAILSGNQVSSH